MKKLALFALYALLVALGCYLFPEAAAKALQYWKYDVASSVFCAAATALSIFFVVFGAVGIINIAIGLCRRLASPRG